MVESIVAHQPHVGDEPLVAKATSHRHPPSGKHSFPIHLRHRDHHDPAQLARAAIHVRKLDRRDEPARAGSNWLRREDTIVAAGGGRATLPTRKRLAVRHSVGYLETYMVFPARAHRRTRAALIRHVELVCASPRSSIARPQQLVENRATLSLG